MMSKGKGKGKGLPKQAWTGPRGSGSVKAPDFLMFSTTRVVGRQSCAPAAFTPIEIPATHFSEAESTPGHMVLS